MNQKGMTLTEMLVAGVIGSIAAFALYRVISYVNVSDQKIQFESEYLRLREDIRRLSDCTASFIPGTTCPAGGPRVAILKKGGGDLIAVGGTKIGTFTLVASCNASNDGLIVRASMLRPGAAIDSANPNDFLTTPGTQTVMDWNHPKSLLFPQGTIVCPQG